MEYLGVLPLGVIQLLIMENFLMSSAYSQIKLFVLENDDFNDMLMSVSKSKFVH